ncbi:MAG: shikimate dehydrogenase [Bacteroidetes bacterium]|nr:shikimate dehydrogenase [Bacteroidota bacterium]
MRVFGLIGYPLSHSFSPGYFSNKFARENIKDTVYQLFPLETIEFLPQLLLAEPSIHGLNVTIPYKQQVIPFLSEIDDIALKIGAVNTIKVERRDSHVWLKGFNTDFNGVLESLKEAKDYKKALVLGNGGAAKAVLYALEHLGIDYKLVSRAPATPQQISYQDVTFDLIKENSLIINTTPLGMYPNIDACPSLPYEAIGPDHFVFDLIYNPEETLLLKKAKQKGAKTLNGLLMLHTQAETAWHLWNKI